MKILQINASARSQGANSTRLADTVTDRLVAANPGAQVTLRDLSADPLPVLDEAALAALFTPAEQRSPEQAALAARFDAAITQLQDHDTLVLGVPMYNFGVPVQLKGWIDAVARAGVTFRYTETGPEGLVTGKKVFVACARGGIYRGTANDSQTPYLRTVLGFLGMTDIEFIYAEGLAMGPEAEARGLASAREQIAGLFEGQAALAA